MAISENTWSFDHILLKSKKAAEWAQDTSTVLLAGEFGVESDTGKFKIGDGSSKWSARPYATMTVSEINTALAGK
ncbi:MAG: hypothetical protein IJ587_11645, partial [Synergistaceae bacterium]|nr:hypothetical protein [Synergistaceae bacterium]